MAGAAILDTVEPSKIRACHMGHDAFVITYPDIHGWLAEMQRLELAVDVRDMDQRHVAVGFEIQQPVLRQGLLSGQARPIAKARGTHYG